jgi:hypothetical protein
VRPQAEPIISENNPGISRNQADEGFNSVQYENGQQPQQEQHYHLQQLGQPQQEQHYHPQQLGQNDILYTVPQESMNHNHFTSNRPESIPDANPQATPDLEMGSSYFLNFSLGEAMPSNIFEELLAWEGNDMIPP